MKSSIKHNAYYVVNKTNKAQSYLLKALRGYFKC